MSTIFKSLAACAVILAATPVGAGEFPAPGPRGYAPPHGRGHAPFGYRGGYIAPRYYAPQDHGPDLGAAIAG
ncbi:MAG: hypothetical protein WBW74_01270, partial [Xanthobacteraceae bacterium]